MANPSIPRTCLNCGNSFLCTAYQLKKGWGKYCSHACHSEHRKSQGEERFWSRVDKHGPVPEHKPEIGPCWIWTGGMATGGYGSATFRSRSTRAHRLAYQFATGTDPGNKCVCHSCDNPLCVRPDHLWLGTHTDNHRDMETKRRNKHGDQHWTRTNPEKVQRGDRSYQRRRPDWLARGERHGNARLTEEIVRVMRYARVREGLSYDAIAIRFGFSKAAVYQAVIGKTWKHVN